MKKSLEHQILALATWVDEDRRRSVDTMKRRAEDIASMRWRASVVARQGDAVVLAAAALLAKIDDITTEDFAHGAEKAEREALRTALAEL